MKRSLATFVGKRPCESHLPKVFQNWESGRQLKGNIYSLFYTSADLYVFCVDAKDCQHEEPPAKCQGGFQLSKLETSFSVGWKHRRDEGLDVEETLGHIFRWVPSGSGAAGLWHQTIYGTEYITVVIPLYLHG